MILSFELSMPKNNSWNRRWSGENNFYAKVVNFGRNKEKAHKAREILDKGRFYYDFGDGWNARVIVREVDGAEASKIRKKSRGFCGYDWMVTSIMNDGYINCND